MNLRSNPITRARALFLGAAFASFVFSVSLYFTGSESQGIFVGLWVPSIIALGAFLAPRDVRVPADAGRHLAQGSHQ
jgi:hypothetical protein